MKGFPRDASLRAQSGLYVGIVGEPIDEACLVGPFLDVENPWLVLESGAVHRLVPRDLHSRLAVVSNDAIQQSELPMGRLNSFFVYGLHDGARTLASHVEWWRPTKSPEQVRWIAYRDDDIRPTVAARGSFTYKAGRRPSNEELLRELRWTDPLSAHSKPIIVASPEPRGENADGSLRFVPWSSRLVRPGMTVQIRTDDGPVDTQVLLWQRVDIDTIKRIPQAGDLDYIQFKVFTEYDATNRREPWTVKLQERMSVLDDFSHLQMAPITESSREPFVIEPDANKTRPTEADIALTASTVALGHHVSSRRRTNYVDPAQGAFF